MPKIYTPEQLAAFLEEHRQLFQETYLDNIGTNSAAVSRNDLNEIQAHLAENKSVAPKIMKRINNPRSPMFLVPFPNGRTYVCRSEAAVPNNGNQVSQRMVFFAVSVIC